MQPFFLIKAPLQLSKCLSEKYFSDRHMNSKLREILYLTKTSARSVYPSASISLTALLRVSSCKHAALKASVLPKNTKRSRARVIAV